MIGTLKRIKMGKIKIKRYYDGIAPCYVHEECSFCDSSPLEILAECGAILWSAKPRLYFFRWRHFLLVGIVCGTLIAAINFYLSGIRFGNLDIIYSVVLFFCGMVLFCIHRIAFNLVLLRKMRYFLTEQKIVVMDLFLRTIKLIELHSPCSLTNVHVGEAYRVFQPAPTCDVCVLDGILVGDVIFHANINWSGTAYFCSIGLREMKTYIRVFNRTTASYIKKVHVYCEDI